MSNSKLPPEEDVRAALEDNETVYHATKQLRVSRETLKAAIRQYDLPKPDYWITSPQQALRLARGDGQ